MLTIENYCKFREYCHYTGDNRGAAHNIYNLKYSIYLKKLP